MGIYVHNTFSIVVVVFFDDDDDETRRETTIARLYVGCTNNKKDDVDGDVLY